MKLEAKGLRIAGRLESCALSVASPELICLVGPNGSGKTSLLHALAGIGSAEGALRIDGVTLSRQPALRRREIGYLPASRDIAWPLAARDLVALGGATPAEAQAALEAMGALSLAERRMDRLSTGERSRILIARALAPRPKLLLLDEPNANLDPAWQIRLMALLARIPREDGRIVIAAMHDLDLAAAYADRLLVMDRGRVAADDAPAALIGSAVIPRIFGIERKAGSWRLAGDSILPG